MTNTTTTVAGSAKPAASSLAASSKFKTFVVTFGIASPLIYLVCLFWNFPLVTYHPAVNRLDLGFAAARSGEGPAMYWYGWTLTTLLGAAVIALIATMLPESVTKKIPLALLWVLPVLAVPFVVYSLMPFWTHP